MEYSDLGGRRRRLGGCFSSRIGAAGPGADLLEPSPGPFYECRRIGEGQTIIELLIGMFLEIEAMDHHPIFA